MRKRKESKPANASVRGNYLIRARLWAESLLKCQHSALDRLSPNEEATFARNHRITMIGRSPLWYLWCLRWWPANAGEAADITSTAANNKTKIFFISAPVIPP
jgi:hypothetical protein